MTTKEFKNEFNIHYNAIASNSAPSIDDYELSVYLTKAQLEIIKDYYNPLGNKYKKGFESTEKRRVDLKELLVDSKSTTKITSLNQIIPSSQIFKIPNNVFLPVYESVKVSSTDCLNNTSISVYVKTHDEFNTQIKNPFKRPDEKHVWRIDYSIIGADKVVELISSYNIVEYQCRYIKYPSPIIISNLSTSFPSEGLSIDGQTAEQTCMLNEEIHREILDRAIEIALRDYKPSNLESKIQLDTRNE